MIRPILSNEALLATIRSVPSSTSSLHFWWLGQSGFLVHWQGSFLLFDPYLSDSLTEKYADTDKPHVRMTERVIAPEQLGFVKVVTSSHNHTDHLDRETLRPILAANPSLAMVAPEANREFIAERLGTPLDWPHGLAAGGQVAVGPFRFHGVPAAHNTLETDTRGHHRFMGFVVEAGPWRIYHAGDTLRYPGMEEWLRPWNLDLAFLPINGDRAERRVAGNLDGPQAAQLAHDVGIKLVIPCHFEMFAFNTASPDAFTETCRVLKQPYQVMKAGEWGEAVHQPHGNVTFLKHNA